MKYQLSLRLQAHFVRTQNLLSTAKQNIDVLNMLLIIAFFLGIYLRFAVIAEKKVLEYDDAITILAATGHEGEYAEIFNNHATPLGSWVAAEEWLRMTKLEAGRGFLQIAKDLSVYDIHPPLYFWMLHSWISVFGESIWATHALNLLLDLIVGFVLFYAGYQVFQSYREALLVSAVWILNPVGIKMTFWMRQYTLLTLVLLLFAILLYRSFYSERKIRWLSWTNFWLVLTIMAGMLTQYYSAVFILVGLFIIIRKQVNIRQERRFLMALMLTLLVSGVLFLMLFPNFFYAFQGFFMGRLSSFTNYPELNERVRNAAKTTVLLFSPILACLGLLVVDTFYRVRKSSSNLAKDLNLRKDSRVIIDFLASRFQIPFFRWSVYFAVFPFAIILLIYLSGISQVHTFSSRYLGYIAPYVAFACTFLLGFFRNRPRVIAFYAGAVILMGLFTLVPGLAQAQQGSVDRKSLQSAEFVIVDGIENGMWPVVVQFLKPDQKLFLDSQENLAEHPETWIHEAGDEAAVYVSIVRGVENTQERREIVLATMANRYQVEKLSEATRPEDWILTVYRLSAKPAR